MLITIDGASGQGKSTVAQKLADELHFEYIDSGNLYRLLALIYIQQGGKEGEVIDHGTLRKAIALFNGTNITDCTQSQLRSDSITRQTSAIARLPYVRKAINEKIASQIQGKNAIIVGRDMCLIFPYADLKIVFRSSLSLRAKLQRINYNVSEKEAMERIAARDRSEISIHYPADAIVIELHEQSLEDLVVHITEMI